MLSFLEKDLFDWGSVPPLTPEQEGELNAFVGTTDQVQRVFPLTVALQAHGELETELMRRGEMPEARMREIRGGMMALKRFAELYTANVNRRAPKVGDEP